MIEQNPVIIYGTSYCREHFERRAPHFDLKLGKPHLRDGEWDAQGFVSIGVR